MKRKITTELKQFKKLGQMCDFGTANRDRLAPGTPAAESLAALTTTVSDLKTATATQAVQQLSNPRSMVRFVTPGN